MAVSVEFFGWLKKLNSTKKPNHTTDVFMTETCVLKEPCDVIRPVLRLKIAQSMGSPDWLNYAYIDAFQRFYWVNKWICVSNDQWECELIEDFLASWKSAIGDETKYILRSASNYDGSIIDTYYPAKATHYQNAQSTGQFFNISNSSYVIGIIGAGTSSGSMGAVQYYAMSSAQLVSLFNSIFSSNAWLNISTSEMSNEMQKAFINPFQYVASAMLFPFDVTALASATYVTSVEFGWWTLNTSAYRLPFAPKYEKATGLFTIPKHPQAATRGIYLNSEPYSTYMLYVPGCGYNKIDAGALQGADKIAVYAFIDLISGQEKVVATPYDSATNTYLRDLIPIYGQAGVPIELAQIGRGPLEGISHSLAEIASAALQGLGGPIANTLSGIVSAAGAATQTVQSKGSTGSTIDFQSPNYNVELSNWNYLITDSDLTELGAPLCQSKKISTLSGFILCEDGEMDCNGLFEEKEALKRFLTTGFYYE